MTNYNLDYYMIECDNTFISPRLVCDDEVVSDGTEYLYDLEKIEEGSVTYLTFGKPIPRKPEMVDYLKMPGRQVFSKKIQSVLNDKEIKGLQLVPAIIRGKNNDEFSDYWVANVYQEYGFLDKDKSQYERISPTGRWVMINKMVINEELILKVPLEERLVFVTKECGAYVFYHKSIVDRIMSVKPTGLVFVPVDKWYNGIVYSL